MSMTKTKNQNNKMDKNLQDDWIPDHQRRVGATSAELAEYGGDIKGKETIKEEREPHSHSESINKKNIKVEDLSSTNDCI